MSPAVLLGKLGRRHICSRGDQTLLVDDRSCGAKLGRWCGLRAEGIQSLLKWGEGNASELGGGNDEEIK